MLRAGSRLAQNGRLVPSPASLPISTLLGCHLAYGTVCFRSFHASLGTQAGQPAKKPQTTKHGRLYGRWKHRSKKSQADVPATTPDTALDTAASKHQNTTRNRHGRKSASTAESALNPFAPKTQNSGKVIYTVQTIPGLMQVPTSRQYGPGLDVNRPCDTLTRSNVNISAYKDGSKVHMTVTLDEDRVINVVGDTQQSLKTERQTLRAAALHAICKLHERGWLADLLPGGPMFTKPVAIDGHTPQVIQDGVVLDVVDFVAREGHELTFTHSIVTDLSKTDSSKNARSYTILDKAKSRYCEVAIPALGIYGRGRAKSEMIARARACHHLKDEIEKWHKQNGNGLLLVREYTKLNSASAEKFVEFFANESRLAHEAVISRRKTLDKRVCFAANVTLTTRERLSDTTPKKLQRGYDFLTEKAAKTAAYLAAAITLKEKDPALWTSFVKEIRRGNGTVLLPVPPIDHGLDWEAIRTARSTTERVRQSQALLKKHLLVEPDTKVPQAVAHQAESRSISIADQDTKNHLLLSRLKHYESNEALKQIRDKRAELPMVQYQSQVMEMINNNDVCVVVGATGSGKTTQLPQLILEEYTRLGKGASCNIMCTQPRRIAATSVAQRVVTERHERMRDTVGYSVRFDSQPPKFWGSIHYCTTGILLKQLQVAGDDAFVGLSHIIVDEVHERDIQIDFLLIVLKDMMAKRKAAGLPAIKVILMSATIDTNLFCKYFGAGFPNHRCPYIKIPGRTFPVTTHYLEDVVSELRSTYSGQDTRLLTNKETKTYLRAELDDVQTTNVGAQLSVDEGSLILEASSSNVGSEIDDTMENTAVVDWDSHGLINEAGELETSNRLDSTLPAELMGLTIAHLMRTTTEGSILVFLPGLAEITKISRMLRQDRPLGVNFDVGSNFNLYTLHSSLPQMQQEVFQKLPPGMRKVILATNIAETSITIPDVVYVVDSNKARENQFDKVRNMSTLVNAWTAKSNAKQRAGRAGRVQNGHYYSMATRARYESFQEQPVPEILRADLQELVLQTSSMNIPDVWGFISQAIQPPKKDFIERAIDELQSLKALDSSKQLTPLGRLLSTLPLSPALGKMIVLAALFKCLDPILILAAASSTKDIFISPPGERDAAAARRALFTAGTNNDHYTIINAMQKWRTSFRNKNATSFGHANFIHNSTVSSIFQTADQILETLQKAGIVDPSDDAVGRVYGMRRRYGTDAENVNSGSIALQAALATAGFYPNIAVQRKGYGRFLRTPHDNEAMIHTNSSAAPPTVGGRRYGRIDYSRAAPGGSLYTYSHKTQSDDSGVMLRGVAPTSPLAVILFGGKVQSHGSIPIITVDEWMRFFVAPNIKPAITGLSDALDEFLANYFTRLGTTSRQHLFGDAAKEQSNDNATHDKFISDNLIPGVVKLLNVCYENVNKVSSGPPHRSFGERGFDDDSVDGWEGEEDIGRWARGFGSASMHSEAWRDKINREKAFSAGLDFSTSDDQSSQEHESRDSDGEILAKQDQALRRATAQQKGDYSSGRWNSRQANNKTSRYWANEKQERGSAELLDYLHEKEARAFVERLRSR